MPFPFLKTHCSQTRIKELALQANTEGLFSLLEQLSETQIEKFCQTSAQPIARFNQLTLGQYVWLQTCTKSEGSEKGKAFNDLCCLGLLFRYGACDPHQLPNDTQTGKHFPLWETLISNYITMPMHPPKKEENPYYQAENWIRFFILHGVCFNEQKISKIFSSTTENYSTLQNRQTQLKQALVSYQDHKKNHRNIDKMQTLSEIITIYGQLAFTWLTIADQEKAPPFNTYYRLQADFTFRNLLRYATKKGNQTTRATAQENIAMLATAFVTAGHTLSRKTELVYAKWKTTAAAQQDRHLTSPSEKMSLL